MREKELLKTLARGASAGAEWEKRLRLKRPESQAQLCYAPGVNADSSPNASDALCAKGAYCRRLKGCCHMRVKCPA